MRRVISLWLPHFAMDRLYRRPPHGDPPARPRALLRAENGHQSLAAVDARAAAAGLAPGQPLADARAMVPELEVAAHDPEADLRALARLAAWCGRYTPWVALDKSGCEAGGAAGLLLDISGCAHLFGGEAALLDDLVRRIGRLGCTARAALADTPGAAWAMARFGQVGAACVLPPGGARSALAKLPVAALRLPSAEVELLERLGLRRIGDLYPLSPAALAPRLGPLVARRLDQALGREHEAVSPLRPVPPLIERHVLPEPTVAPEAVARGLERLIGKLCRRLEAVKRGVRRLVFTLYRVDGTLDRIDLGTSRPTREPRHLQRLFDQRLEQADPGFGVEVLSLAATATEPLASCQIRLPEAKADPLKRRPEALGDVLDRLMNRLGPGRVTRPVPRESHLPERAAARGRPLAAAPDAWPRHAAPRPLRLFARPQPIEATALLPDHPPVQFRWHRLLHRVAGATGPERITPEWWHPDADKADQPARDYFQVEDTDGRRYWVFRAAGRWYLHGLCA